MKPNFLQDVKDAQRNDKKMDFIKKQVKDGKRNGFEVDSGGNLWFQGRICVPGNNTQNSIPSVIRVPVSF